MYQTLQPGFFICWKRLLQKDSSALLERPLSGTANQHLCCQTLGNRALYSRNTSKESTKSWLDLHTIWWPENKDFLELKQMTSDETTFPRCADQICIPFSHCCCFCLFHGKTRLLSASLKHLRKGGNSSFDYGLWETPSSWSWDKLNFHLLLLKGWKVQHSLEFSFIWTIN